MVTKKVIVIGAGFSGISSAAYLAKEGYQVTVIEKNSSPGGRARSFTQNGFTYDMGPSWYWMPDVFESFFQSFNRKVSDYYQLERLDPSYKIALGGRHIPLPAEMNKIYELYEELEPGSSKKLSKFLSEGEYKYRIGIGEFVHKPGHSIKEFLSWKVLKAGFNLNIFSSFANYTNKYFKNPIIRRLLEFPILFLGGTASTTPALYSLMNYSDMVQGTWYPAGGMYKVVQAMVQLAEELGVKFIYNAEVSSINIINAEVISVTANSTDYKTDYLIASGDYQHIEQNLIPLQYRKYSKKYWDKRVLSPSSLIYYLGFDTRIPELEHHTILFNNDFESHAHSIYNDPSWPENPSIYISCTSRTDKTVAPEGHENVMVLIPVAPALNDSEAVRQKYFDHIMAKLNEFTGRDLSSHVVFKRSYAHKDFEADYHAFKGNAYGLANTLLQTAFLKPKMRNSKIKNMLFAGQLTVPGPGVPPAIISGEIAAKEIIKCNQTRKQI